MKTMATLSIQPQSFSKAQRHQTWPRSRAPDHSWAQWGLSQSGGLVLGLLPLLKATAAPSRTLCSHPAPPTPRGQWQLQSQQQRCTTLAAKEQALQPGQGSEQPASGKRAACKARTCALLLQFRAVWLKPKVTLLKASSAMLPPDV